MRLVWAVVLACVASVVAILLFPSRALAAEPTPGPQTLIGVLPVDSEDAEDQAEALTSTLRGRVQNTNGLKLAETTQSLGMLTAALKCGRFPDAACQTKMADTLKLDRFIWGTMQKTPGAQVTVDLHLYQRGKPDTQVRESYSDNLKDQNDDTLRKIAQRIVDRLFGRTSGTLVVRVTPAGAAAGELTIDGSRKVPFDRGAARVELAFGAHTVEVAAKGFLSQKKEVTIPPGGEVPMDVALAPGETPGGEKPLIDTKGLPLRKIIGYGSIGVGVASGVVSAIFAANYFSLKSDQDALLAQAPNGQEVCDAKETTAPGAGAAKDACDNDKRARTKSALAWTFGGVAAAGIGVGVYLILTDHSDSEPPPKSAWKRVRAIPEAGPSGGSLTVVGSF